MRFLVFLAALLMSVALGCNSGPESVDVTPPASPGKAVLEDIANTGEISSGIMELDTVVADVKAKDPAKGEKLAKELDELKSLRDPAQIKAKAKSMADQL